MSADKVIRFTSRVYSRGEPTGEVYTDRTALSQDGWFADSDGVEWAVRLLSGVDNYQSGTKFTARWPSLPGTVGSAQRLDYIDAHRHQLDDEALKRHVIAPDPDASGEVWITRARLEGGFIAAERRRIYAALKQIAIARDWHESHPSAPHRFGSGHRLHVLETGDLPGW